MLLRPTNATENIDCDGCTACCRGEAIVLQPFENPALYDTVATTNPITGAPAHMLKLGEDGACSYLGEGGCTIYERRPAVCRGFSCIGIVRQLTEQIPRQTRRKLLREGKIDRDVWDAGSRRLEARS